MKIKSCEIVIPSSFMKVDVAEVLNKRFGLEEWLYILHDKDIEPPHYHIYIHFHKMISIFDIAEEFRIHVEFILSCVVMDIKALVMYLTHEYESQKYKYIYPREELHSNFNLDVYLK